MKQEFTAAQFTPTEFHTAEDKAKFANHFVRFVTGGFKRTLFPKWFYKQLSFMYGHIAHFNQNGFYATWFSSHEQVVEFMYRVEHFHSYGSPAYTYSDVEKALSAWARQNYYRVIR